MTEYFYNMKSAERKNSYSADFLTLFYKNNNIN